MCKGKCSDCRWFSRDERVRTPESARDGGPNEHGVHTVLITTTQYTEVDGFCRKRSPNHCDMSGVTQFQWPIVKEDDWCGDFKERAE